MSAPLIAIFGTALIAQIVSIAAGLLGYRLDAISLSPQLLTEDAIAIALVTVGLFIRYGDCRS
jgi:hypothetical protein